MLSDAVPLPGYPAPYDLLCAILQDGTSEWRAELAPNLGPEVATWRARPSGQSIGAQMLHIIGVELFWFEQFALGREFAREDIELLKWHEIDVDEGHWPEVHEQPLSWYFDLHDRYRARTLEAIKEWPSAETRREHHGREVSLCWVLGHVIQHESYHGGQIVLLHDLWKNRESS